MRVLAQPSWRKKEPLRFIELPTPEPHGDELRVKVRAAGVNPVDWKMLSRGVMRAGALLLAPSPAVPGVDFAGVVEAVGPRVKGFRVGDRVAGGTNFARRQHGSFADTVLVRQDQVARVPEGVSDEVAGSLCVAAGSAHAALFSLGRLLESPQPRRVLILGASGGVGICAVQLARNAGAFVVGVCSGKNADFVRGHGAGEVLDYTVQDPLEAAKASGPYALVVDAVGSYEARRCRSLLAPGGRHVNISGDSFRAVAGFLSNPRVSRLLQWRPDGTVVAELLALVEQGKLALPIHHRLPLEKAEEALQLSESGRVTGKIVLLAED